MVEIPKGVDISLSIIGGLLGIVGAIICFANIPSYQMMNFLAILYQLTTSGNDWLGIFLHMFAPTMGIYTGIILGICGFIVALVITILIMTSEVKPSAVLIVFTWIGVILAIIGPFIALAGFFSYDTQMLLITIMITISNEDGVIFFIILIMASTAGISIGNILTICGGGLFLVMRIIAYIQK